jgi:prevent-host-death family protein
MKVVPIVEAKNHLSSLVALVEQGQEIAITRRGRPVARLVPCLPGAAGDDARSRASLAMARLRELREGIVLEGDLKAIAREGLAG